MKNILILFIFLGTVALFATNDLGTDKCVPYDLGFGKNFVGSRGMKISV